MLVVSSQPLQRTYSLWASFSFPCDIYKVLLNFQLGGNNFIGVRGMNRFSCIPESHYATVLWVQVNKLIKN